MVDKKMTAMASSVGADERQSNQKHIKNIIPTEPQEINSTGENSQENIKEIYRRLCQLSDPYYLHTVSMTELYQTSYGSRPPIIDGLLYTGAYILAGAPKIGKSFLVGTIPLNLRPSLKPSIASAAADPPAVRAKIQVTGLNPLKLIYLLSFIFHIKSP